MQIPEIIDAEESVNDEQMSQGNNNNQQKLILENSNLSSV